MKIGIGISTYNRFDTIKTIVNQVQQNTQLPHRLIVSSDGSVDGTNEWLLQNRIPCILGSNKGVMYNKNRLLTALQDCDYICILEDDIYPRIPSWIHYYIDSLQYSGYHHLCYKFSHITKIGRRIKHPTCTMVLSHNTSGLLMVFTKKVLEVCGGYNMKYHGYGYGHIEFSTRIAQSGLCHPDLFADTLEGNLAMSIFPDKQVGVGQRRTLEEIKKVNKMKSKNKRRFRQFKKSSKRYPEVYRYQEFRVPIKVEE